MNGEEMGGSHLAGGMCQFCGRRTEKLKQCSSLQIDLWVCAACEKRIREKIRRRYIMAGEQTEPAE